MIPAIAATIAILFGLALASQRPETALPASG